MARPPARGGVKPSEPKDEPDVERTGTQGVPDVERPDDDAEVVDPWAKKNLDYMRQKLEGVGCTPGEIEDFTAQWLGDNTWSHDEKVTLMALGDAKLSEQVKISRAQGFFDTTTEAEEEQLVGDEAERGRLDGVRGEALQQMALEPDQIIEWAGDNTERLLAVLDIERGHPRPRTELVDYIEAAIDR